MSVKVCAVEGCGGAHEARGLCAMHYQRVKRHGSTNARVFTRYDDPEESFKARTKQDGDCLVWTGRLGEDGYGTVHTGGKFVRAHRYAWMRSNGPVPSGYVVDHKCWNRACVNVEHLRLATTQENSFNLSGPRSDNTLGIRNVYPHSGGFAVQVKKDGTVYGTWHRDVESAQAEAAMLRERLFGEFAGAHLRAARIEAADV